MPYKTLYWRKNRGKLRTKRRHKQLPNNLKEKGLFWKLKKEATDLPLCRTWVGMD
jgi:hypothetical protein